MSRIYADASEVLVWLGSDYGRRAKSELQEIVAPAPNNSRSGEYAITSFLYNPYWRLVWIIQEIAKGIEVRIVWGNEQIAWEDITTGLQKIYDVNRESETAYTHPFLRNIELIMDLKRFSDKEKIGERISFYDAMVATRLSESTEPRDKVLAILGLTADGNYVLSTKSYFKSDFEISLEISSSLFRMYPEKLHHIFLGADLEQKEMPSWLPDWFSILVDLPPGTTASPVWINTTEKRVSSICSIYPALKKNFVVSTSTQTYLQLSGKRIGLVGEARDRCILPLQPQYANHILQRTLEVMDLPFDTDDKIRSKKYMKRAHFARYAWSRRWMGLHEDFKIGGHCLSKWASVISESATTILVPPLWKNRRRIFGRLYENFDNLEYSGMQLFTTSDGIIGLGPKDTQHGDYVYQLSGYVAILREHQDGYRLVGQAFVNVMNYAKISTKEEIKATKVPGYLPSPLLPRHELWKRRLGFGGLLKENHEPDLTNLKEEEIMLY